MITEDYVNFEIAKLLKEKGFDVYGDGSFGSEIKIWMEYSPFGKIRDVSSSRPSIKGYPAPTLQMAMKWLREVYNIFIEISVSIDLNGKYHYRYSILNRECEYVRKGYTDFDWDYKQSCEAAIKYCLENLI